MAYDEPRSAPGRATAATPRANDAPRERLPRWKAHARVCYGPAMSIRLANLRGRATLVMGEGLVDVEERSGRRFSADPMAAMRDWAPLADWPRGLRAGDATAVLRTEELGPPVPRPGKVFAIRVNYRAHVAEAGVERPERPSVFAQFPSALARTSDMIFGVPTLVAYLARHCTLDRGDLIFTGTPSGVGSTRNPRRYLRADEEIVSTIERIGTLRNRCVSEAVER